MFTLQPLLKITHSDQIQTHPFKGSLFENMMVSEYVMPMYQKNEVHDIWFWCDAAGHEVDFVIQNGYGLSLTEFKSPQTIMSDLFKGLHYSENLTKKSVGLHKTLVYAGDENQQRTKVDVLS